MAESSAIEWTDATWNPVTGCTLVSEGCRHCYAARLAATRLKHHPSRKGLARRNAAGEYKFTGEVRLNEQWLDQPLRWTRPRRIFVCAHGDLFHENVPYEWIDRVFAVMALCSAPPSVQSPTGRGPRPQHIFQVLTKRPVRMQAYMQPFCRRRADGLGAAVLALGYHGPLEALRWPLPNVWLGTSVEDQATADARIPDLLSTPAAIRFASYEPALGPVDFNPYLYIFTHADQAALDCGCSTGPLPFRDPATTNPHDIATPQLDWIIAGGESGPHARPAHPGWFRAARDQCAAAGVAFFFKQWGRYRPLTPGEMQTACAARAIGPYHSRAYMRDAGKKAAGALLDGREHRAFPEARA